MEATEQQGIGLGRTPGTKTDPFAFLEAEGACAAEIRARDWAPTPLGDPAGWSDALRAALATMLSSPEPMFLVWGQEALTFFFNDLYRPVLGRRVEGAMGRAFPDLWSDAWPDVAPLVARAFAGEGSRFEDFPLVLTRNGPPEETWWTFSYTPLRDGTGAVRGMLCIATETSARRSAERQARAERARLHAMFEHAPSFMAILEGPDHRVTMANGASQRLVGGRKVLGRPVAEALPEAVAQGYVALLDVVRSRGEAFTSHDARYAAPGTPPEDRRVDVVLQPIRDAEGAVTGIFVQGHDVTNAHAAREVLRASEERFRLMADAVPQILWIMDGTGRTEFVSRQWFDYTGADPGLLAAEQVARRFIHPDDVPATLAAFDDVRARRGAFDVEHRIQSRTGEWRWFLARGEPDLDPATGEVRRVYGASVDIHDRKLAEARLRDLNRDLEARVARRTAERHLLATIVETTDSFIQVADPQYRLLAINKASADEFARIYGPRPRPGDSMIDLLAPWPEHQEAVRAIWARALAGESFTTIETFGDPSRDRRTYEIRFNVLRDRAGQVVAAFQIVTDVTERLRDQARLLDAEAQLRQSQKMEAIGQLTGGVAHDFNNLLTPIIAGLDILQRRAELGPREARLIGGALQSAERAKTLVSRLLSFARRQPLQTQAVDLGELLEGMRDLVASTTGPHVRVEVAVEENLPPAMVDANQVEMAVLNLAVNARDAMPEGGALRLSVTREEVGAADGSPGGGLGLPPGPYLRLVVADTGEGMEAATLARATEPFFSTKGPGKGTGLGLAMVQGLATQLGGALGIESGPGRGTAVALWLPAALEALLPATPSEGPQAGGTVLLVDDEALVREATADMLRDLGWEVVQAATAEAALRLVEEAGRPDLLVTDHLMPGLTGTDLALRLRARWPDLPVLVVSGYAESLSPSLPRLAKPFRRAELARRIDEAVRA